ncbi:MAG: hypothetical protein KatS3mg031_3130 [Chitinophagales bacterium]|nr:MAG: hypothetical protein KatS3mg031_3130 [Chitinophagales bacterium]
MPDPGFSGVEECLIALPNDDSPIDFDEVVEKYKSLGKGCRERLRAHALQHFSWKTIMARVVAEVLEEGGDSDGRKVAQRGSSAAKESIRS